MLTDFAIIANKADDVYIELRRLARTENIDPVIAEAILTAASHLFTTVINQCDAALTSFDRSVASERE